MKKFCEICGKEFASNRRQQFCSAECAKKAKVARNRKYKQTKKQECKINCLKICPICEKEFTPRTSRQKYCSLKCQQKAQRVHARLSQKWQKVCEVCGKEFRTHSPNTKTCSPECTLILRQERTKVALKNFVKDKVTKVADEEFFVRLVTFAEDYTFKSLKQAVNFLSIFTEYDTEECIDLLREHKNKIGSYKIFYE